MKTKKLKEEKIEFNIEEYKKRNTELLWQLRAKCWENAVELLKEAKILLKNKKYSRSFFLAHTALEEFGKYLFICDYITGIVSQEEFKNAFSDHGLKIAYAHNMVEIKKNKDGKYDFTLTYEKSKFKDWIMFRNNSLYVGIKNETEMIVPKEIITRDFAKEMCKRANDEMKQIVRSEVISERIGSQAFYK